MVLHSKAASLVVQREESFHGQWFINCKPAQYRDFFIDKVYKVIYKLWAGIASRLLIVIRMAPQSFWCHFDPLLGVVKVLLGAQEKTLENLDSKILLQLSYIENRWPCSLCQWLIKNQLVKHGYSPLKKVLMRFVTVFFTWFSGILLGAS